MHVEALTCVQCGETYAADMVRYACSCGGSLDVSYDYDALAAAVDRDDIKAQPLRHARYRPFLPVEDPDLVPGIDCGGTPLVASTVIGPELGIDLYFKLEGLNPTGSFKDRGTMVELAKAREFGADEIVVASTGNMGASIAAYAARAGVNARIYVPADVTGPKLRQMQVHDAEIVRVDGDYTVAAEQAWTDWEEDGTYLMGDYPYRGEGEKTVGHELADQISADTVAVPVGNGTLIHAVWKGFREFERLGWMDAPPRLLGVQAAGCNTVVNALQKGFDTVAPADDVDTVAGAIACGDPLDGDQALAAIKESSGYGAAVSDEQILDAQERLAADEGLYAEPAGAAGLAGILDDPDRFDDGETVVCLVTGHGLKTSH